MAAQVIEFIQLTKERIALINGGKAKPASAGDKENRNIIIDNLESRLRSIVVEILKRGTGKEIRGDLITGDVKSALKTRIRQHVNNHPGATPRNLLF
jgi:hypothetical protein